MVGIQQNVKIVETKKINKVTKYRFKTEEEFKREGLWRENAESPLGWVRLMLPMLGKEILEGRGFDPKMLGTETFFYYNDPDIGNWEYRGNQVVKIVEKMERIYRENWGDYSPFNHILGVEMQNGGDKYYLNPNVEGFVPVNLKSNKEGGYSSTDDLENGFNECSVLNGNKRVFKFDSMQEMIVWATS